MRRHLAPLLAAIAVAACAQGPGARPIAMPGLPAGAATADPALAVDPASGDLLLSWMAGDSAGQAIWFARADPSGRWSSPVRVAGPSSAYHPHAESAPRLVALAGGVVALVFTNSVAVPGRRWPASNVLLSRSSDGGASWSAPLALNDDTARTPAGHLFQGAASLGDSGLVVAWLDSREAPGESGEESHAHMEAEPDAQVVLAQSFDRGATWAERNTPAWDGACPCCRVALARDPSGGVSAAWRAHFPGDVRDPVAAPLGGDPVRVSDDGWVYPGCPHAGPAIAIGADGTTHVAWYLGREGKAGIWYARRAPDGAVTARIALDTLEADHPQVAVRPDGSVVVAYAVTEGRSEVRLRSVTLETSSR